MLFTCCFSTFFPEVVGRVCRVCRNNLLSCQVFPRLMVSVVFKWWEIKALWEGKNKWWASERLILCLWGLILTAEELLSSSLPSLMLLHDFSCFVTPCSKPCHDRAVTKHHQSLSTALAANHSLALSRASRGWILVCISSAEPAVVFAPAGARWHWPLTWTRSGALS